MRSAISSGRELHRTDATARSSLGEEVLWWTPPHRTAARVWVDQVIDLRRKFESLSTLAGKQAVGLGVAKERFVRGVPTQGSIKLTGDVGQMAYRDRAMPDLHIGGGKRSRFDAVEPVLHVPPGLP